jgi:hypothetical protein
MEIIVVVIGNKLDMIFIDVWRGSWLEFGACFVKEEGGSDEQ